MSFKNESTKKDTIVGRMYIKKKLDGEPSKLLTIMIFNYDKQTGQPKEIGKFKTKDQKTGKDIELPKYEILHVLKVPISTLGKVALGKADACAIFYDTPKQQ